MPKRKFLFITIGIFVLILLLLRFNSRSLRNYNNSDFYSPTIQTQELDCIANSANCPEITINGDPFSSLPNGSTSNFRGYADPSIRKDPNSQRLWMTYSWTGVHFESKSIFVPTIDIHLAYSDDGGKTWRYSETLWKSYQDTNKGADGDIGYSSYEVSNILPVKSLSGATWYGARAVYFMPMPGGFNKRPPSSIRLLVSQASSIQELSGAPFVTLGTNYTSSAWGVDFNLATLSPELSKCSIWNEPALYHEGNKLYLALECLYKSGSKLTGSIVVFSTIPQGDVKSWKWEYKGELGGKKEGKELGGEGLTQIELAKSIDGKLLAIVSPEENQSNHMGCRVVEVESLENPQLARDEDGKLKVRASITASDLGIKGPGACAYDPASSTGLIIVRRMQEAREFVTTLNATAIKP